MDLSRFVVIVGGVVDKFITALRRPGMSEVLRECPFCGSEKIKMKRYRGNNFYYAECTICNARGPLNDWREAIAAWNRRAKEEK